VRHGLPWTSGWVALFATLPDDEVAERLGRTENAVRVMRTRLKIAMARDRRRRGEAPWSGGSSQRSPWRPPPY
jgi:hypothetical protein